MPRISFSTFSSLSPRLRSAVTGSLGFLFFIALLASLCLSASTTSARSRRSPLRLEIKIVDSATGRPRSKFVLGEQISMVYTLTNQSNVARVVTELSDTSIPFQLYSQFDYEEPETRKGSFGGTSGSYVGGDGTVYWTVREARKVTLAPGQTLSVTIKDLGRAFGGRLQEGRHILTATYNSRLQAKNSFRIVVDHVRSVPLLEQMANAPVLNGDESDRIWANAYLRQIKQPSISGRIVDGAGKPLKEVWIDVTGTQNTNIETRSNGRYHLTQLTAGGTYTLTPSVRHDDNTNYKITPASITIPNVKSHVTRVDFTVTRQRP